MNLFKYIFKFSNKRLKLGFVGKYGRNFFGHICVHHKRKGNKNYNYFIDLFRRVKSKGVILKKLRIASYTSFVGLILYENGLLNYILLSEGWDSGNLLKSGDANEFSNANNGDSLILSNFNLFSMANNIELLPYKGASICRAAGTGSLITGRSKTKIYLKLKNGKNLFLSKYCLAIKGIASNSKHKFINYKKAGISFKHGKRPIVRGVAKNPCDHPHGGGEGKKSPPVGARSPWGWLTKSSFRKRKRFKNLI